MEMFLKIHPNDTVAVALKPLPYKTVLRIGPNLLTLREDIPAGHKFALLPIAQNEPVIKYGFPIGHATQPISPGSWVHTHNLKTGLENTASYTYRPQVLPVPPIPARTFLGFWRSGGKVGIRNEIWIIPTVGCVNNVATALAQKAQPHKRGTVDAIAAFPHPYGCSQMGDDQESTRKILADLINHPNAGGVLVLGLGCENSGVDVLKSYIGPYDENRVKFLVCQDVENELEEGLTLLQDLISYAGSFHREAISCSELIVGLKCGGSDGFSGITANPVTGRFTDSLIAMGGTAILTEVPEMFGAETLLMNRCADGALFEKTVTLIDDFKKYFTAHHQTVYENPSPGNKKGGISTLEDKSLGCVQKSGSTPVRGVLSYGEPVHNRGLNLLSAPGNDLVASTALAASGAQIVLFTTGRGTPFACPVPTVKISSNTPLCAHKKNWIDFDCGPVAEGKPLPLLADELLDFVLGVAGGQKVKSEEAGFHDMAIFKQGVTL